MSDGLPELREPQAVAMADSVLCDAGFDPQERISLPMPGIRVLIKRGTRAGFSAAGGLVGADLPPGEPAVSVDHRALLVKYVRFIEAHEGRDFTEETYRAGPDPQRYPEAAAEWPRFTDAEWAELQRIAEEARR